MIVHINQKQVKLPTGVKVYPEHWDKKNAEEKEIKRKFNETSDILDDFNWNESGDKDYFLYSMLKKEFEFPKVFDRLEKGKFKDWENVKYFGIKKKTSEKVREQVKVLYYLSLIHIWRCRR